MEGAHLPERFWPTVRWVFNNLAWIVPLVSIERFADGDIRAGIILALTSIPTILIASNWRWIMRLPRRWRR